LTVKFSFMIVVGVKMHLHIFVKCDETNC
jgi:hypothetical protein